MSERQRVCLYAGEALARYAFGGGHPYGGDRQAAFWNHFSTLDAAAYVDLHEPVAATRADLLRFHTREYVERVHSLSQTGHGYLDSGDTPAFAGMYEAAANVVGGVLDGIARIIAGEYRRAFVTIAGLHHAQRDAAAGFCVFNDCGVAIETLRAVYGIQRIVYVDIDAHHGDGVFYAFEQDPDIYIADVHEDGNYLYPGTGAAHERGVGAAAGTKLNLPLAPGAGDAEFLFAWAHVERFLSEFSPQFVVFQCGVDSLAGDPITHLRLTPAAHAHAARALCRYADACCDGRLLALGGGGYNRDNLARGWTAVVRALTGAPD